ncbi:class I SAM-dependent methyltransferase [Paenibacillus eucommiae]|uniref:Trans-aconitate methyltransferase n=1 Tax=Paenibacillus eucommiae TaxID=1355755 RepID=A0ABS4J6X8_9BACL|nr:class I SAM-dependent methyltransferase [Paenibacillus eucommiae]MBP1995565.1 trans-aconitate methyltransferase [Paenibacillus eucommiae]
MSQLWNARHYDTDMAFVSQFGESLIDLLHPAQGERIIDWGCGTGDLAAAIADKGAVVTGIDASPEMIETAHNKYPHIQFVHADGQFYSAVEPVDAIFSNAALHWMTNAESTAASIAALLRTNGRFVAEFGGDGNIASIVKSLPNAFQAAGVLDQLQLPWYFPSIGQYASLLERNQMRVDLALCFDRPTPLLAGEDGLAQWLSTFANGILSVLPEEKRQHIISFMEAELKPSLYENGQWVMDYRRIRVVAVKK